MNVLAYTAFLILFIQADNLNHNKNKDKLRIRSAARDKVLVDRVAEVQISKEKKDETINNIMASQSSSKENNLILVQDYSTIDYNFLEAPEITKCPYFQQRNHLGKCTDVISLKSIKSFIIRPSMTTTCPQGLVRLPNGSCSKRNTFKG